MTTTARQKAYRMGHAAEWRAVWRLRLGGYTILMRRYKTRLGEIDIVARRGNVLAFVEVKARAAAGAAEPECFVGAGQRRRVRRAALAWLAAHPQPDVPDLRFDVVAVTHHGDEGGVDVRHLPAAF